MNFGERYGVARRQENVLDGELNITYEKEVQMFDVLMEFVEVARLKLSITPKSRNKGRISVIMYEILSTLLAIVI